MGRLAGKVALVTGAARGQGRSHARRFAAAGADVVLVDACASMGSAPYAGSTPADLDRTREEVALLGRRVVAAQVDVRDADLLVSTVRDAAAELGGLDVVSVNAGIVSYGRLAELPRETWQEMIDVNLTGAFHTVQATVPLLVQQGRGGAIVFTSSTAGLRGSTTIGHYSAAKHGVIGLAQTLALELAPHGVRVNVVCPSNVDTPMIQNAPTLARFFPDLDAPTREDAERAGSPYRAMHPMDFPWVDAEDVTDAVLFLASDEARRISGVALPIDGARLAR
ncbi:mycofactocin-coupled SDR family oxidoreductase [Actinomycetospora termitidis]|uniref:Mycofactocin-coupled SDR family oxidoreductase n=1 Tax=Actinomycetospora termitidis TaxID=3053470 RepID=A0ABT7M5Z6_9PSEU|nr:mycofactocin-coupled SDR family oxidoreductase [Actinomycetospora sp. Odt1-22]MDL5156100.1 mycofactocin-coupled SDR family oxidoreductase [Actinomycetospora sp. Odt1-22]